MLKLNASYSKKVPAEGEYSSQSYHASIEVELSDGLTADQIQDRIHETFEMVRDSVEAELHGNGTAEHEVSAPRNQQNQGRQGYRSGNANYCKNKGQSQEDAAASPKQIKYLLDLARTNGVTPQQILTRFKVNALEELTRNQCSMAIDEFNGKAA
ncbi:MAG: hypothetical protein IKO93_08075 [Lentisphaeria bacterium]|nr:hypothetical protein [Lentisphaeria bacterium]